MVILTLTQLLLGLATLPPTVVAAVFVIRRDSRAPLWMVVGGAIGLVFFLTFDPLRFEMIAPILLIAAGVLLMMPSVEAADVLDDIEVGESTATRRRR